MMISRNSAHIFKIKNPLQNLFLKLERNKSHNHEIYLEFKKNNKRHLKVVTDNLIELEGKMKDVLLKLVNFDLDPFHTKFFFKGTLHKDPGYHLEDKEERNDVFILLIFYFVMIISIGFIWIYNDIFPKAFKFNPLMKIFKFQLRRELRTIQQ